jgi:YrbI family 3-deoxy-D-manno-octulosonate 8-phosphate phosphatase
VLSGDWEPVECFTNQKKKEGKVPVITSWLEKHNLTWSECVYIGDDRTDWEAMSLAGLKVAPANATRMIKKIADIVLEKEGGNGAIREFAELVLDSRNIDESTLPSA